MTEEAQKKIFLNFSKLEDHDKVNQNGIGLGLSICKEMIDQMGGSVEVNSVKDSGTDFIIELKTWCLVKKHRLL